MNIPKDQNIWKSLPESENAMREVANKSLNNSSGSIAILGNLNIINYHLSKHFLTDGYGINTLGGSPLHHDFEDAQTTFPGNIVDTDAVHRFLDHHRCA